MRKGLITLLAVAALGTAVAAAAHGPACHAWLQERHSGFVGRRLARELDLTDAQRESIRTILQNERPTIQALAARFEQQNEQLRSKNTFDEAFVRSLAQAQSANFTDAVVEKEKIRGEIFQVLTPAQQQKADQMVSDFHAAMKDRLATLGDSLQ
jgi:Spy/CpxP family protein refolding chaperone